MNRPLTDEPLRALKRYAAMARRNPPHIAWVAIGLRLNGCLSAPLGDMDRFVIRVALLDALSRSRQHTPTGKFS